MKFLSWTIFFAMIVLVVVLITNCEDANKRSEHDKAVHGCVLIGTIEGYELWQSRSPAQEQWKCGNIVKTVNAVK